MHWDPQHQEAFDKLKQMVANPPILQYYDVNKAVTLQTDASKCGLGAVLMQNGLPVAYGSRALDQTQQKYATIEKELLAIALFAKAITVETDHKPLLGIMAKPLHMLSARLQRIRMRLQRYDLKLQYKPGKEMLFADMLSRAYVVDTKPMDLYDEDLEVCVIQATEQRVSELQKATKSDPVLVQLVQMAREQVYWPGINSDIEDIVSKCAACQSNRKVAPKEPMISHEIPNMPWTKVGIDLFHFRGREYVLCVDYFSKYPDMCLLPDLSSHSTIQAIKAMFGRFGIPMECVTDSGPQFNSSAFKEFADSYEFKHTTISPTYSQSNGQVERTVQTVKNILRKCQTSGDDPTIALLSYRNTPLEVIGKSPAQLLMNRRLRTRIPIKSQLLKPEIPRSIHQRINRSQALQKQYYDRRANKRPQTILHKGNSVRFKSPQGLWKLGVISDNKPSTPRSYNVISEQGHAYRRNRHDIFPTKENVCINTKPKPRDITVATTPVQPTAPVQPGAQTPTVRQTPPPQERTPVKPGVVTRSGRVVKPPQKYLPD